MSVRRGLVAGLLMCGAAGADIYFDGVSQGDGQVTLNHSVGEVLVTSGELIIAQNGNVNSSMVLSNGTIEVQGGNISSTEVHGGLLEVVTPDRANFNGGLIATGGRVHMEEVVLGTAVDTYGLNGPCSISGDADVTLVSVRNVNASLMINDSAVVRFLGDYQTAADQLGSGLVVGETDPILGSISSGSLGCNTTFSVDSSAALYVGIPEPTAVSLVLLSGVGLLGAKRFFV